MKKILVFLFSNHDLHNYALSISKLRKLNPDAQIHLVSYLKNKNLLDLLLDVDVKHYLDHEKIKQLFESNVFSSAYSLNLFLSDLEFCTGQVWDIVYNLSNDDVSSFLLPIMHTSRIVGKHISPDHKQIVTNDWGIIQGYSATIMKNAPLNQSDLQDQALNLEDNVSQVHFKIDEQLKAIAKQNFSKIKSKITKTTVPHLVGLVIDDCHKVLSNEEVSSIIKSLANSRNMHPIVLTTGSKSSNKLMSELNQVFGDELDSITCQLDAIPAILLQLDVILSADSIFQHYAEMIGVKQLVIVTKFSRFTPPARTCKSLIIDKRSDSNIEPDCIAALTYLLQESDTLKTDSKNKIYEVLEDDFGTFYSLIAGPLNIQSELEYHVSRVYLYHLMGQRLNKELLLHLSENTEKSQIQTFVTTVRDELTNTVKILLSCLRSLKTLKQSKDSRQNFVVSLDQLINIQKTSTLVKFPVALFEGRIESISINTQDGNMKLIEEYLFELKNNIQLLTHVVEVLLDTHKPDFSFKSELV